MIYLHVTPQGVVRFQLIFRSKHNATGKTPKSERALPFPRHCFQPLLVCLARRKDVASLAGIGGQPRRLVYKGEVGRNTIAPSITAAALVAITMCVYRRFGIKSSGAPGTLVEQLCVQSKHMAEEVLSEDGSGVFVRRI